jgi:adenine-specific DNA-methyltransferase
MIDEEFEKGTTFWVKSGNFAIRAIYHEGKTANNSPRQIIFTNKNNSLCTYSRFNEKIGTSEEGTGELKDLFGGVSLFDYPKPVSLISYLCSLIYNEQDNKHSNDGIFLDFFAGSGTLAHAVINLNKKDKKEVEEARFPKGTDIGKKGKGFEKIAKSAAKRYGSEEAGKKVAGSILKKVIEK